MATFGNVGEFKESEESWTQYAERLEQYFVANEIKDEKKQRAILLSVCGSKTYGLIRDLLQPKKPGRCGVEGDLGKAGKPLLTEAKCDRRAI